MCQYFVAVGDRCCARSADRPTAMERWPGGYRRDVRLATRAGPARRRLLPEAGADQGRARLGRDGRDHLSQSAAPPTRCVHRAGDAGLDGQLGTLRFHPWPVRRPDADKRDQLRIDLDPQPGTDFADAARVADELRGVLEDAGLGGYPKTSGGRGVHVFVPVEPTYGFVEARHAAIALGRELSRRMPDHVTISWWKEERGERIFVDFNQMTRDRTIASAYPPADADRRSLGAADLGRAGRGRRRRTSRSARMPGRFAETGTPGPPSTPWSRAASTRALEMYARDERELGTGYGGAEMPYPPDYPKMPGEPARVQPSRARAEQPGLLTVSVELVGPTHATTRVGADSW